MTATPSESSMPMPPLMMSSDFSTTQHGPSQLQFAQLEPCPACPRVDHAPPVEQQPSALADGCRCRASKRARGPPAADLPDDLDSCPPSPVSASRPTTPPIASTAPPAQPTSDVRAASTTATNAFVAESFRTPPRLAPPPPAVFRMSASERVATRPAPTGSPAVEYDAGPLAGSVTWPGGTDAALPSLSASISSPAVNAPPLHGSAPEAGSAARRAPRPAPRSRPQPEDEPMFDDPSLSAINEDLNRKGSRARPKLRFREAATLVLTRTDRFLTAEEIAEEARRLGILDSSGLTPGNSMNAALHKDMHEYGAGSRFAKLGPGQFCLRRRIAELTGKPAPKLQPRQQRHDDESTHPPSMITADSPLAAAEAVPARRASETVAAVVGSGQQQIEGRRVRKLWLAADERVSFASDLAIAPAVGCQVRRLNPPKRPSPAKSEIAELAASVDRSLPAKRSRKLRDLPEYMARLPEDGEDAQDPLSAQASAPTPSPAPKVTGPTPPGMVPRSMVLHPSNAYPYLSVDNEDKVFEEQLLDGVVELKWSRVVPQPHLVPAQHEQLAFFSHRLAAQAEITKKCLPKVSKAAIRDHLAVDHTLLALRMMPELPGQPAGKMPIGGLTVRFHRNGVAEIIYVCVWDQRRGFGTGLMDRLKLVARNCGYRWLVVAADADAIRWYKEKQGFSDDLSLVEPELLRPTNIRNYHDAVPMYHDLHSETSTLMSMARSSPTASAAYGHVFPTAPRQRSAHAASALLALASVGASLAADRSAEAVGQPPYPAPAWAPAALLPPGVSLPMPIATSGATPLVLSPPTPVAMPGATPSYSWLPTPIATPGQTPVVPSLPTPVASPPGPRPSDLSLPTPLPTPVPMPGWAPLATPLTVPNAPPVAVPPSVSVPPLASLAIPPPAHLAVPAPAPLALPPPAPLAVPAPSPATPLPAQPAAPSLLPPLAPAVPLVAEPNSAAVPPDWVPSG